MRRLLGAVFGCVLVASAARAEEIDVESGRPVSAAVRLLEKRYGYLITYEDPRDLFPVNQRDVTDQTRRGPPRIVDGKEVRTLVPKGGRIRVQYDLGADGRPRDIDALLARIIRSDPLHAFRVEKHGSSFHVIPAHGVAADGTKTNERALLDERVSLPPMKRGGLKLLQDLTQALRGRTAKLVFVGTTPVGTSILSTGDGPPNHPFFNIEMDLELHDRKARELLEEALGKMQYDGGLSWSLNHDPTLDLFALNVHRVKELRWDPPPARRSK